MTNAGWIRVAIAAIVGFLIAMGANALLFDDKPKKPIVRSTGSALIGGPFALIDQNGKLRTDKDFRGKPMLVFFGYTHCPDVCPAALQTVSAALDKLGADAAKLNVVFISVDPKRDTPAHLKTYAKAFHKQITYLTGTSAQVAKAAKAYRVYYNARKADADGDYTVDHSAFLYLMGPAGKNLAHFRHGTIPDSLVKSLRKHL